MQVRLGSHFESAIRFALHLVQIHPGMQEVSGNAKNGAPTCYVSILGIHTQECTYSTGGNGQQQVNNLWRTHKKGIDSYMRSLAVGTDTAVGNFSTCWTNKQPYISSFCILLTVKTW